MHPFNFKEDLKLSKTLASLGFGFYLVLKKKRRKNIGLSVSMTLLGSMCSNCM
jgi:hypothetical protein